MNNLVFLASHIPNAGALSVGVEIFDEYIKKYLPDADIVVGINPSPVQNEWIEIIKRYTDNYEVVPEHRVVNSDASAYQQCLVIYDRIRKQKKYDNIWFIHTQGTKSGRHDCRRNHMNVLLGKKDFCLERLYSDVNIGAYCYTQSFYGDYDSEGNIKGASSYEKLLDVYYTGTPKYKSLEWFSMGTMFLVKALIIDKFLDNTSFDIQNNKLFDSVNEPYLTTYGFEVGFPAIVSKLGYVFASYYKYNNYPQYYNYTNGVGMGKGVSDAYKKHLQSWCAINNLPIDCNNAVLFKEGE